MDWSACAYPDNAIWKEVVLAPKQEPTWTMDEIESWYTVWVETTNSFSEVKEGLLEIKRKAALKQDPEYKEYLRLQAKFGGK